MITPEVDTDMLDRIPKQSTAVTLKGRRWRVIDELSWLQVVMYAPESQ